MNLILEFLNSKLDYYLQFQVDYFDYQEILDH